MPRIYTQVRQLVAQKTGLLFVTGTADTGGSTNTLKDAILQAYPNDRLIGGNLLLTSGSPTYTELLVTDSVQSTGLATFVPALGAAPDALTYELLPFSGTDIMRAVQEAAHYLYDRGTLVRQQTRRLFAESPLFNCDWGSWSQTTYPDGWEADGASLTLSQEQHTSYVWGGTGSSLKAVATAADYIRYSRASSPWRAFLWDFRGGTVTLRCPMLTSTASAARLNLYTTTDNYSSYHSGSGDWEVLSVPVSVGETLAGTYIGIEPRLTLAVASTVYFGPIWIEGPEHYMLPFPIATMPDGPSQVLFASSMLSADAFASSRGTDRQLPKRMRALSGWKYYVDSAEGLNSSKTDINTIGIIDLRPLPAGTPLYVVGDGPLTIPTTSTSVVECSYSESNLLATVAARILLEKSLQNLPTDLQRSRMLRIGALQRDENILSMGVGSNRNVASLPIGW